MANINDVHKRMREAIKTMKYINETEFKQLITLGKFDEAIAMIDGIVIPESNDESESSETKPKRKYTKKSK